LLLFTVMPIANVKPQRAILVLWERTGEKSCLLSQSSNMSSQDH